MSPLSPERTPHTSRSGMVATRPMLISARSRRVLPMPTYLVRHAKAGSRRDWEGPDECRPRSAARRAQDEAIAGHLRSRPITRLLSSPYLRCVQTLEPLGKALG